VTIVFKKNNGFRTKTVTWQDIFQFR